MHLALSSLLLVAHYSEYSVCLFLNHELMMRSFKICILLACFSDRVSPFSSPKPSRTSRRTRTHDFIAVHPADAPSNPRTVCFSEKKGGTARFTGVEESGGATGALDFVLSLIVSDIGSIILGVIGLTIVVGHRLGAMDELVADTMGQETRSDLLATFACGAVLLNGVSKLDVTSALAESVQLDGVRLSSAEVNVDVSNDKDLRWGLESLLLATPAKSVVLLAADGTDGWNILASAGIVPKDTFLRRTFSLKSSPIIDRFRKDLSKESYLPTLQALPGRSEFTYLPLNTQGALLLPVIGNPTTVLVLGSDTAKSFTPRDVAWSRVLSERISSFL